MARKIETYTTFKREKHAQWIYMQAFSLFLVRRIWQKDIDVFMIDVSIDVSDLFWVVLSLT